MSKIKSNTGKWLPILISTIANVIIILTLGGYLFDIWDCIEEKKNQEADKNKLIAELQYNQYRIEKINSYFKKTVVEFQNIDAPTFEYKKIAFEIAQTSGAIRIIDESNRDSIERIYINLEELKYHFNWYINAKLELYFEYIIKPAQPNNTAFRNSIKRLNETYNLVSGFEEVNRKITSSIEDLKN